VSKAGANFLMIRIHSEHPEWVSLVLHPGVVQSDLGNTGARAFGMDQAPLPIEKSAKGLLERIYEAKREENVKFVTYTGEEVPW
jgi:norsolorinic acid ketoreductase